MAPAPIISAMVAAPVCFHMASLYGRRGVVACQRNFGVLRLIFVGLLDDLREALRRIRRNPRTSLVAGRTLLPALLAVTGPPRGWGKERPGDQEGIWGRIGRRIRGLPKYKK